MAGTHTTTSKMQVVAILGSQQGAAAAAATLRPEPTPTLLGAVARARSPTVMAASSFGEQCVSYVFDMQLDHKTLCSTVRPFWSTLLLQHCRSKCKRAPPGRPSEIMRTRCFAIHCRQSGGLSTSAFPPRKRSGSKTSTPRSGGPLSCCLC